MAASLATLRKRADRLQAALAEREARASIYTTTTNRSGLPGADRWPEFAALTYVRSGGTIKPFVPYDYQEELVTVIQGSRNTICLKSRQVGASETVVNYLSCRAATEPGFVAIVISKTQNDSSDLARRARFMLNSIQGHSFQYATDSNTIVSVKGGGTIYFLPGSPRAARGIPSGSVLWIDEGAFVDGAEEIYQAASPALAMLGDDAQVIVTSTPDTEVDWYGGLWNHGIPDDWYDYVLAARANPAKGPEHISALNLRLALVQDDWARVAVHWTQHPVYNKDPNWATKTRESRRMTQAAWDTEYELSFGSTDTQVYPTHLIRCATRGHLRECGSIGRTYVIGIDPNAGGSDYFVAIVLDITTKPYEVVGLYRQNGKSTDYSLKHVKALIEDFMPERVIVEKQAMGAVIGEALQLILPSYAIELFNTSRPSKITATDRILYLMEHDELIFPDGPIPEELRAFQQGETGNREAAPGFKDDCVMALAFACSLIPETPNTAGFFAHI
jgi:hypothetical protein